MHTPLKTRLFVSALAMILSAGTADAAQANLRITVGAGDQDRVASVVTFASPGELRPPLELRCADGAILPLQVEPAGPASFLLPKLAKGTMATFEIVPARRAADTSVDFVREKTRLKATLGGKPVLQYQAEPGELPRPNIRPAFLRGGYIQSVFSPAGSLVTDDYPTNHLHHHGIWFPWTKTEFEGRHPDFWNMGDGTGCVEFSALDRFWSGPVHGGFVARHHFVDLSAGAPKVALNETWDVRLYAITNIARPLWIFDLVSIQECASSSPLKLLDYRYGGLGFRGSTEWNSKDKQPYLTSEGISDKLKGNETRGRWCYIGGPVQGKQTGVAIFCHPNNFRAPQPMRLNPDEPFFCYAPPQLGEFQIEPGKPYVSRYRFVVFDGPPDPAELDRLWNDYAKPVEVKVSKL